jgi:hypothetical protein
LQEFASPSVSTTGSWSHDDGAAVRVEANRAVRVSSCEEDEASAIKLWMSRIVERTIVNRRIDRQRERDKGKDGKESAL